MRKLKISLFLVLGLLLVLEVSGQNNKSSKRQISKIARNSFISPSLARKLSLFIQMNERAYIVCNSAICERKGCSVPLSDVDRIIINLDKSKEYPKYLTIRLYQTFGVQLMYFALKNYMSIKEIDVLESVWNKELSRIEQKEKLEEQESEENEQKRLDERNAELKSLINNGMVFNSKELDDNPRLNLDDDKLAEFLKPIDGLMNLEMNFIIDKSGNLQIEKTSDTGTLNDIELKVYDILKDRKHVAGSVLLKYKDRVDTLFVPSRIKFEIKEMRQKNGVDFNLVLIKDKKSDTLKVKSARALKPDENEYVSLYYVTRYVRCLNERYKFNKYQFNKYQFKVETFERQLNIILNDEPLARYYYNEIVRMHSKELDQVFEFFFDKGTEL